MKPSGLTLDAMKKLEFLSGNWSWSGWIQMGREKHYFSQTETVDRKVNETVIIIDGVGLDTETEDIIHQAFAVISFDMAEENYLIRAFRADGNYIDAEATVNDDGAFVWGFAHPQAREMRYTIELIDDKWVEKGEMSRDGENWFHFFEMTLEKDLYLPSINCVKSNILKRRNELYISLPNYSI